MNVTVALRLSIGLCILSIIIVGVVLYNMWS